MDSKKQEVTIPIAAIDNLQSNLEDTYYHLKGQNDNKELYSYETHAPMVFNKHKLLKIIKKKPIYSNGRNERVHRNKHVGGSADRLEKGRKILCNDYFVR